MLEQYQNFLRNNLYLLTIKQMTVFNQKEYLITEMDNWVINFIPVIKEVQKEVVKEDNEYFYITSNGKYIFPSANKWDHDYVARKQYGNYYPSRKAAEAVYNLRVHTYNFTPCKVWQDCYFFDLGKWLMFTPHLTVYSPEYIPMTSTQYDRDRRYYLINQCMEHLGYLSI